MKKIISNLLLLSGGLVTALILCEVSLRLFYPQVGSCGINSEWIEEDRELEIIPAPNVRSRMKAYNAFDVAISTNSARLRGSREVPVEKTPGRTRILFLGDSFIFGWGVEDDETLPARLEALLKKGGADVEVLNGAVYGYDMIHYERWYRRLEHFRPDLVILGFCIENDFFGNAPPAPVPGPSEEEGADKNRGPYAISPLYHWIKENFLLKSHLFAFVLDRVYLWFPDIRKTLFRWGVNGKRLIFLEEYPPELQRDVRATEVKLVSLAQQVSEVGARFLVLGIPMREQVYSGQEIDRFEGFDVFHPNKELRRLARSADVPYLDLLPGFTERAYKGEGARLYFENDPHFTPAGNEAGARVVMDYLLKNYPDLLNSTAPRET